MKKILFLFSVLAFACVFASCGHTHTMGEKYESDSDYHWYPCLDGECSEMLDVEKHTWGAGEVTTKPTATKDGVMSYICTVCKALKQEPVKYTAEPTVTNEQWQSAFYIDKFYNVTAKITEEINGGGLAYKWVYDIQASNGAVYAVKVEYRDGAESKYSAKYQEGFLTWELTDRSQTLEDVTVSASSDPMDPTAVLTDYGFEKLSSLYGSFTYNGKTKCYEATDVKIPNSVFIYEKISVKLEDGQVTQIKATVNEEYASSITVDYCNYGKTTPTPPTKADK